MQRDLENVKGKSQRCMFCLLFFSYLLYCFTLCCCQNVFFPLFPVSAISSPLPPLCPAGSPLSHLCCYVFSDHFTASLLCFTSPKHFFSPPTPKWTFPHFSSRRTVCFSRGLIAPGEDQPAVWGIWIAGRLKKKKKKKHGRQDWQRERTEKAETCFYIIHSLHMYSRGD